MTEKIFLVKTTDDIEDMYAIDWFKNVEFTKEEIELIKARIDEIMDETGHVVKDYETAESLLKKLEKL